MTSTATPSTGWSTTTARKRNRSPSATTTLLPTPDQQSMTHHHQRSDTEHRNSILLSPSRQLFLHLPSWPSLTSPDPPPSTDTQHPHKRRKGVAGAILSTALEAALYTSAIGYAAYNFWCGKGLEEEETNRLSPRKRFPRLTIASQSPPSPPPYEPAERLPEQTRISRVPRKSLSNRTISSHRLNSSRPQKPPSIPPEPINFILRPSMNLPPLHQKDQAEISNQLTPACEPIVSHELDDEEYEDDEELKAFKAQIQGLIKEGKEALASRPCLTPSINHSSSSSSLHAHPPSAIAQKSKQTTNTHRQTIITSTDKSRQSVAQLDENVQLLHFALEKAALPPHSNWWER